MAVILIMDDNASLARLLGYALEDEGHSCNLASDGREAWTTLCDQHHDLLISDLHVSKGEGGQSLLENIRQGIGSEKMPWLAEMPVIVLTGKMSMEDQSPGVSLATHLKVDAALLKPAPLEDVCAEVERLLNNCRTA